MKAFNKDIVRSIRHSLGRFVAIAAIVALGCGFYAGLRMTAPDMKLAADAYYDGTDLMDIRVVSTLGLTDEDIEALRDVPGVSGVEAAYSADVLATLNDEQYVKNPVVVTRRDFNAGEYSDNQLDRMKLLDGVRLHESTKAKLEVYARTFGKRIVKPFVLVVAKDTEHSKKIMEYVSSPDFFDGYYADKVIEVNSTKKGAEKDENIELLLSLEKPENKIEIVIHVNMLKEGWDVTNLYTIVPLRTSETLTEQTIGRGLRLPYGERTGDEYVDRLSIVSHDKYAAIIAEANDPNSLVRKVYFIDAVADDVAPQGREFCPEGHDGA